MHLELYGANLHVGGAVNTTASIADGVVAAFARNQFPWVDRLQVVLSPAVLGSMSIPRDVHEVSNLQILERYDTPLASLGRLEGIDQDLRYVFFGPDYQWSRARVNIAGFADGTVISATSGSCKAASEARGFRDSQRQLKRTLKRLLLVKYDGFVVQTASMADALLERFPTKPIAVVPNVLSPAFIKPELRVACQLPERLPGEVRLAFPAKGYPHKNHLILAPVSREFQKITGNPLTFIVTLDPSEYADVFHHDDHGILNVGPLHPTMMPSLLEQTDGLFFPSLNETFSAAPLEAAFMRKPIMVSDLPYARELLGDFAFFFNPFDPFSAAQAVAAVRTEVASCDPRMIARVHAAHQWSRRYASPEASATTLMNALRVFAEKSLPDFTRA